jgi:hypothetical protein
VRTSSQLSAEEGSRAWSAIRRSISARCASVRGGRESGSAATLSHKS